MLCSVSAGSWRRGSSRSVRNVWKPSTRPGRNGRIGSGSVVHASRPNRGPNVGSESSKNHERTEEKAQRPGRRDYRRICRVPPILFGRSCSRPGKRRRLTNGRRDLRALQKGLLLRRGRRSSRRVSRRTKNPNAEYGCRTRTTKGTAESSAKVGETDAPLAEAGCAAIQSSRRSAGDTPRALASLPKVPGCGFGL